MEWIGYLIATAVAAWAVYSIVRSVRKKGCGCGCGDCRGCSACEKKKENR